MNTLTFINDLGEKEKVRPGSLLLFQNESMTCRIVNITDYDITLRWTHHFGIDTFALKNMFCRENIDYCGLRKTRQPIVGLDGIDTTSELRKMLIS